MKINEISGVLIAVQQLMDEGEHAKAEKLLREAVDVLQSRAIGSAVEEAEARLAESQALRLLSQTLWRRGNAPTALPYAEQALAAALAIPDRFQEARCLGNIGMIYDMLSDSAQSIEYLKLSLALFEELEVWENVANVLGSIGLVYSHLDEYTLALEYMYRALAMHEKYEMEIQGANVLSNIGGVYQEIGDYTSSLEYFKRALAIHERYGRNEFASSVIANIGGLYWSLAEYERALEYFLIALALDKELGSEDGVAKILGNIGVVYYQLKDYPLALDYYRQALELYILLGLRAEESRCIANMGGTYYEIGSYMLALEYLERALAMHQELGMKADEATVMVNIGSFYADPVHGEYDSAKAEKYLLESIDVITQLGAKAILRDCYRTLTKLYEQENQEAKAYRTFKKFHELNEELHLDQARVQAEKFTFERQNSERERKAAIERAIAQTRIDEQQKLIHNILPPSIAHRLLNNEKLIADHYDGVSVLFMDLVGFTRMTQKMAPKNLIQFLNIIFSNADNIMKKHGLEKIKTIGDAYMAAAGAPLRQPDHALRAARAAVDIIEMINEFNDQIHNDSTGELGFDSIGTVSVRIGLHCGVAIGGVIGEHKFSFDLWGDAVNTASRMESHGEAGKIHVSEEFKQALQKGPGLSQESPMSPMSPMSLHFQERGEMAIKGKGIMKTYFLEYTA